MAYTAESLLREIARMDLSDEPDAPFSDPGGDAREVLDHLISEARAIRAVKVRGTGRTPYEQDIWTEGYDEGFAAAMNPVQQQKLRDEGRQLAAHELRERLESEAAEAFALVERLEETAGGDSNDDEIEAGQDCAEALVGLLGQLGFYSMPYPCICGSGFAERWMREDHFNTSRGRHGVPPGGDGP